MGEHDRLFKRAFRLPEHVAGELQAVLPSSIYEKIDIASIAPVPADDVDQRLAERFSDSLLQANFSGVVGYIWFLLEHQSEPDWWMTLRALDYMVRPWMQLVRRHPERRKLPPILCVVLHHGERGWTAPRRLRELLDGIDRIPELSRFAPDLEIIVDDLAFQSDEMLSRRQLGTFAKVVLWLLRDSRNLNNLLEHLDAWAPELERLSRESPEDATTAMRYILTVTGNQSFEAVQERIVQAVPATRVTMATAAEQLIQEGWQRGKAEGKAEGVLAVLEARGLSVSPEQRARICASRDAAELDRWLRRAATVTTVDEIFLH